METKRILKTAIILGVDIAGLYLTIHSSEYFIHYLGHHTDIEILLNNFILNTDVLHLIIDLFPLPTKWHYIIHKWFMRYCATIPKLFIISSVICNLICGNYGKIAIDFGWYIADIIIEKIQHHLNHLLSLINL